MADYSCSLEIYSDDLPIDEITGEKLKEHYIFQERNLNKYNSCPFFNKVKKTGWFFNRGYKVEVKQYQKFLEKISKKSKGHLCVNCVCFEDYTGAGWSS